MKLLMTSAAMAAMLAVAIPASAQNGSTAAGNSMQQGGAMNTAKPMDNGAMVHDSMSADSSMSMKHKKAKMKMKSDTSMSNGAMSDDAPASGAKTPMQGQ